MQCPRCQHDNPAGQKFCGECGARLAAVPAPQTYTPKHLAEKILTSKAALDGERKQVTVLCADLKGSMELLAESTPTPVRPLVAHCHLGLGKLSRRTGKQQEAQEHFTIAITMYREMGMTYWLEQAEENLKELK